MSRKEVTTNKGQIISRVERNPSMGVSGIAVRMKIGSQSKSYKEAIIPFASIFRYYKEDEDRSIIELTDKTEIEVYMPFAEFCHSLHKTLRRNSIADLTEVTGNIIPLTSSDRKYLSNMFNVHAKQDIDLSEIDDRIIILHGYGKDKEKAKIIALAKSDIIKLRNSIELGSSPFLHIKNWDRYNKKNLNISDTFHGPNLLHEEFNKLKTSFESIDKERQLIIDFRSQGHALSTTEVKMTGKVRRILQQIQK